MFISFTIKNYKSFREQKNFNLIATSLSEFTDQNVFTSEQDSELKLLKSTVLYGANASGKTNLIKALRHFKFFIKNSVERSTSGKISWIEPFLLSTKTKKEPSFFEIIFITNNTRYRYGFSADEKQIYGEWLYRVLPSKQREDQLFVRTNNNFEISADHFIEGKGLSDKTRDNALMLTVAAQFNGQISKQIIDWFSNYLFVLSNLQNDEYSELTAKHALNDKIFREQLTKILNFADFGINDVSVESKKRVYSSAMAKTLPDFILNREFVEISTLHKIFDENKNEAGFEAFNFHRHESDGTKRFFSLLWPVLRALKTGGALFVDELDSSLHSLLVWWIVGLFNSKDTNPRNAQLVFTTHDTTLLSRKLLRRDQMWFVDKDQYGGTDTYSLADFEITVRKDASFEKDYQKGKYGGIPQIDEELTLVVKKFVTGS